MAGEQKDVVPGPVQPEPELQRYRVIGSVAVIRKNKHERYLNRGAVFFADALDEENAAHLLRVGLIEKVAPGDDE